MATTGDNSHNLGARELVSFLVDHGHKHVFGLPGSSMVAPIHELQNTDITFVPSIHESVAVAAADGYARVKGEAMVMLYMVPGFANGLANLYNAMRDETPLLLIASQLASTDRTWHGQTGEADLAAIARPFTRFSHELAPGMDVRFWLEQARRIAKGPGGGPAFISIPENVFEAEQPVGTRRADEVELAGAPDMSRVAEALAKARRPLIVAGGQLRRYGGSETLEKLAREHNIALCYEAGFNDRLGFAPAHPCSFGNLMFAPSVEQSADFVLNLGGRHVLEAHRREGDWFPAADFVAHVNADAGKIAAGRPVDWSSVADPAASVKALLEISLPPSGEMLAAREAWFEKARQIAPGAAKYKMRNSYAEVVAPLYDALERGWVVDESVMASIPLVSNFRSDDGRRYVGMTGASLGWATGAAAGVALASGEPVTCVLGDGALRFGALGLWTVRERNLPITFVVLDNGGYGSTRFFEDAYVARLGDKASPPNPSYSGSDMRGTGSSVEGVLEGFGIPTQVFSSAQEARAGIEKAWAESGQGPNAVVIRMEF